MNHPMYARPKRANVKPSHRRAGGDKRRIAATIRRLRLAKGLSQEDLAAMSGYTGSAISRIERRNRVVSRLGLRSLIVALGLTPSEFSKLVKG